MEGLRLQEIRINAKMSQRDVAGILGIAQPHYWKWENSKSYPNSMQIIKLCEIFHCTPNDLFGFYGDFKVLMNNLDK